MDLDGLLRRIDANRERINTGRILTADEARELDRYYKIDVTYSSNALEGNSLTLTETKVLLEDGIAVGGKPMRELMETVGHGKAYDFMLAAARLDSSPFTEGILQKLHRLFYSGIDSEQAGRYREHPVRIAGAEHVPPPPEEVPERMATYVQELNAPKDSLHPVLLAASAHRGLVEIHPFIDGNGRIARLLMNLVLVNNGYCIISIPPALRDEYIAALAAAQRSENPTRIPFQRFIAERELEAQRDHCRLFRIPPAAIGQ